MLSLFLGIISPYRAQCDLIRELCETDDLTGITVGTAETFQGQERPVIIVSTVRRKLDLGFVKDERVSCMQILISESFYIFCSLRFSEIECDDYEGQLASHCVRREEHAMH